jgi:hypothetical protein
MAALIILGSKLTEISQAGGGEGPFYTRLMLRRVVGRSVARRVGHVPGLRWAPVLRLLVAAEIALLVRDHYLRLDAQERRRLVELVRRGRGRRRNLSDNERDELTVLIERMEPRLLAGRAAQELSPLHLPRRVVYGPRRRTRRDRQPIRSGGSPEAHVHKP